MNDQWRSRWARAGRMILGLAVSLIVAAPVSAQTTATTSVTFSKDIAPILQRSCQRCHRPDSVAPMSLLTYEQSRPYARAMKQRTALRNAPWSRGAMPPWYMEKNVGIQKFKDDISLSDAEIALFGAWADAGAPEGNPADLPKPLTFASGNDWTLGKPDLVVVSPSVFVPAVRSDWTGNIGVSEPTPLTEDRYLKSSEFREVSETDLAGKDVASLGGRFVFHHANIRDADNDDAQAQLSPHEVGRNGEVYPADAGLPIKARARYNFSVHIHSSGVDRNAHLEVGFRLHPQGYEPKYKIRRASINVTQIQVDPNLGQQRQESYWVAPENIKLLNYEPHLHATGVRMCMRAINGPVIETLNCAGYDHNWVRNYQYDENVAPLLPKGTIIQTVAWFDNTAVNKNVLDPRNLSRFGFTSVSNMFLTFNNAIYMTDEQYKEELAKRREYIRLTGEEIIGCPDCFDTVAPANYLPPTAATGGGSE